uniref:Uncharacterized protein n=1 Tax=Opuntia streptacantha TaxID=393608 RepID=A0A7C8YSF6_OPUST
MDDYRWVNYNHNHVPAFGSWDYGYDMPYTQCFESAKQAGLVRYGSYQGEERDLYVAGDLYQNDVVTPAVIVVPRRRRSKGGMGYPEGKRQERRQKQEWGYSEEDEIIVKEPPSPKQAVSKCKPIDEDLYKIPPEFLHVKPKRKKGLGLFSSCLLPACV